MNLLLAIFYYFIDLFDQNTTGMPCLKIIGILIFHILETEMCWEI